MAITPASFEPQTLAAGDTLSFLKALGAYLAGAGWALEYELSGPTGNYEFTSAASGNSHLCTVAAAVTATWLPGEYELIGAAVNAASGERVQIYQGRFVVTPNVLAGEAAAQTHAQKMLTLIQTVQLGKAGHDILESDIEGSHIKRLSPEELRAEYNYWKTIRAEEVATERAAQGLPSKRKLVPRFQVTGGFGVGIGRNPFQ